MHWKKVRTRRRKRIARWRHACSYRSPMQVKLYMRTWCRDYYPICPRCSSSMDRDFVSYCNQCGQKMAWDQLNEVCFIKAGDKERKIHVKRRVWLAVTRDEVTERLYIAVPCTEGRNRRRVFGRDRAGIEDAQSEQLYPNRGSTGCISGLSLAK